MTQNRIDELNEHQKSGKFHPLTCCGDANSPSCKRRASSDARWKKSREYLKLDVELIRSILKESNKLDPNPSYTDSQIDNLMDWQIANILASKEIPYSDENEGVLIATESGWICPCGEYKQKITF